MLLIRLLSLLLYIVAFNSKAFQLNEKIKICLYYSLYFISISIK